MTSQNFISVTKPQEFDSSAIETRQPLQHQPSNSSYWQGQPNIEMNYWVLLTVPFLLILAFAMEIRKKTLPVKKNLSPQSLNIPCYQCQYFNQNPYLKCAINPSIALTKEAHECKDFNQPDHLEL